MTVAQTVNMVNPCYVKNNMKIPSYLQVSNSKSFKKWRPIGSLKSAKNGVG